MHHLEPIVRDLRERREKERKWQREAYEALANSAFANSALSNQFCAQQQAIMTLAGQAQCQCYGCKYHKQHLGHGPITGSLGSLSGIFG